MHIIFSNLIKTHNIGDLYSSPFLYFQNMFPHSSLVDLSCLKDIKHPAIIGGGGLLHNNTIDILKDLSNNKNNKVVIWGVGINDDANITYPDFLSIFDLVGIRDFNNPWQYVPCSSCMHNFFDLCINIKPIYDIIIFEHYNHLIPIVGFPKRDNKQIRGESLEEVLSFLCMGETIITNSYHGAYWGLLLGRKVLIYEPFSNRFLTFKPEVNICNYYNWTEEIKRTKQIKFNYLQECRDFNISFCQRVIDILF